MCQKCPVGARLSDCLRVVMWNACVHCGRRREQGEGCYGGSTSDGTAVFCYRQKIEPPIERVGQFKSLIENKKKHI
jgi:hypothetical protein